MLNSFSWNSTAVCSSPTVIERDILPGGLSIREGTISTISPGGEFTRQLKAVNVFGRRSMWPDTISFSWLIEGLVCMAALVGNVFGWYLSSNCEEALTFSLVSRKVLMHRQRQYRRLVSFLPVGFIFHIGRNLLTQNTKHYETEFLFRLKMTNSAASKYKNQIRVHLPQGLRDRSLPFHLPPPPSDLIWSGSLGFLVFPLCLSSRVERGGSLDVNWERSQAV